MADDTKTNPAEFATLVRLGRRRVRLLGAELEHTELGAEEPPTREAPTDQERFRRALVQLAGSPGRTPRSSSSSSSTARPTTTTETTPASAADADVITRSRKTKRERREARRRRSDDT